MINLVPLREATTTATALSGLILVTPMESGFQPQNRNMKDGEVQTPPKKFLFDYETTNEINLQSEIADQWSELNNPLNAGIGLKPVTYRVGGLIGELTDTIDFAVANYAAQLLASKLTMIAGYEPELTRTAMQAYNEAFAAYQAAMSVYNSGVQFWETISTGFKGQPVEITGAESDSQLDALIKGSALKAQTRQQVAFMTFYGYWKRRTLFTVQTPWAVFKNMAIQGIRSVQDETTRQVTEFDLTFKQMQFASTIIDIRVLDGRLDNQASPEVNRGVVAVTDSKPFPNFGSV